MSRLNQVNLSPQIPAPVEYDPSREPSLGAQFHGSHGGVHNFREMPARPFHPTKCAFMARDVLSLAASGRHDAQEFVEALCDVIEDNSGRRPTPMGLEFVVNTGTPSDVNNWMLTVRLTSPINAIVKMVKYHGGDWTYHIERSQQTVRRRGGAAPDRPLHPRRHREGDPAPVDATEYHPDLPQERFLDL